MRRWLVDTQLIADWCLWQLADEPNKTQRVDRAARVLSVLAGGDAVAAFSHEMSKGTVLLATTVLVEVSGVLRRLLQNPHGGGLDQVDRLNENIVRVSLQFTGAFRVELVTVTEKNADDELKKMNARNPPKLFDLGDAGVLAALRKEEGSSLLTADHLLGTHCFNVGHTNVYRFAQGKILDAKGLPLRSSR